MGPCGVYGFKWTSKQLSVISASNLTTKAPKTAKKSTFAVFEVRFPTGLNGRNCAVCGFST